MMGNQGRHVLDAQPLIKHVEIRWTDSDNVTRTVTVPENALNRYVTGSLAWETPRGPMGTLTLTLCGVGDVVLHEPTLRDLHNDGDALR